MQDDIIQQECAAENVKVKIEFGSSFYIGIAAIILAIVSLYYSFPIVIDGIKCPLDINTIRETHN
jgi:hypothetical protein